MSTSRLYRLLPFPRTLGTCSSLANPAHDCLDPATNYMESTVCFLEVEVMTPLVLCQHRVSPRLVKSPEVKHLLGFKVDQNCGIDFLDLVVSFYCGSWISSSQHFPRQGKSPVILNIGVLAFLHADSSKTNPPAPPQFRTLSPGGLRLPNSRLYFLCHCP